MGYIYSSMIIFINNDLINILYNDKGGKIKNDK